MTIIDVSGYNNNCGLYSLGLAVSLAIKNKNDGVVHSKVPDFVMQLQIQDVVAKSPQLAKLGKSLRDSIAESLKNDKMQKERYCSVFMQICLDPNANPPDMESFLVSSKNKLDNLKIGIESLPTLPADNSAIDASISEKEINDYRKELIEIMQNSLFSPDNVGDWLVEKNKGSDFREFVEFCHSFNKIWAGITIDIGNREETKANVEKWFFRKCKKFLGSNLDALSMDTSLLLDLSRCRSLVCGNDDVQHNIKEIYAHIWLEEHWDEIYNNYVEYIRARSVMLSGDELTCLARAWDVSLDIFYDEQTSSHHNELTSAKLHVSIINKSRMHWQVFTDMSMSSVNIISSVEPSKPKDIDINLAHSHAADPSITTPEFQLNPGGSEI